MHKKIYMIRHAESADNAAQTALKAKYSKTEQNYLKTEEYLEMKFDPKYEDCDITPAGFKQCEGCRQKMKDIDVDLVIVSPLRRSITTCFQVFKGHKSNAPVIVDPIFR